MKRGKCLLQGYWKDTGHIESKVIPIPWESGRQLDVLSAKAEPTSNDIFFARN